MGHPRDSLEFRPAVPAASLVARVLSGRTPAEIAPAVVPPVAVGMIDDLPLGGPRDEPVHDHFSAMYDTAGIAAVAVPRIFVQPLEIGRIDNDRPALAHVDVANAFLVRRRRPRLFRLAHESPAFRHLRPADNLRQFAIMFGIVGANQQFRRSIPKPVRMNALSAVSKHEFLPVARASCP
jgi:hypothetical protein